MGRRVLRLGVVGSTQDEARALRRSGAEAGTVVIAEGQERGRGRRGRTWRSPPGQGLYMSLVLAPTEPALLGWLSLACGVAVRDALAACIPFPEGRAPLCKWPNDLVTRDGRKLGGLLLEVEGDPGPCATLGIGINLTQRPEEFPDELRDLATSIAAIAGVSPSVEDLVEPICSAVEEWRARLEREGPEAVRAAFLPVSAFIQGEGLTVRDDDVSLDGAFDGLADDGALRLRLLGGGVRTFHAGEVSVRAR